MEEAIRNLIIEDKILEAITELRKLIPETSSLDELIHQGGRLSRLETDRRKGLVQYLEYTLERNKIRSGVLDLMKRYKHHNLVPKSNQTGLLQRFYFCRDLELSTAIFNGNLQYFPGENSILYQNNVFKNITYNIFKCKKNNVYYSSTKYFDSPNEYIAKFPNSSQIRKEETNFPYFNFHRQIPKDELLQQKKNYNWVIQKLIDSKIPTIDYVHAVATMDDGCGGTDKYIEHYNFKPFWTTFMELKNITNNYISLNELIVKKIDDDQSSFSIGNTYILPNSNIKLPSTLIEPNQSIIFPVGIVVCPYNAPSFTPYTKEITEIDRDRHGYSSISVHPNLDKYTNKNEYFFLGKSEIPVSVNYGFDQKVLEQELYDLDLSNVYSIDQNWMCGSCPHIFLLSQNNKISYYRSIFEEEEGKTIIENIPLHTGSKKIIIAELEDEITKIIFIKLDGKLIYENLTLLKGDHIEIDVETTSSLVIKGFYNKTFSAENNNQVKSNNLRNNLILAFQDLYLIENKTVCKKGKLI